MHQTRQHIAKPKKKQKKTPKWLTTLCGERKVFLCLGWGGALKCFGEADGSCAQQPQTKAWIVVDLL
jgi:hypothetical protein